MFTVDGHADMSPDQNRFRLFDSVAAAGLCKRHAPGRADDSPLGRWPGDPATLDGKGVATAAERIAAKGTEK